MFVSISYLQVATSAGWFSFYFVPSNVLNRKTVCSFFEL